MADLLDYTDRYFNDGLTPSEKEAFEKRCSFDTAFAKEVAVYITIHDNLKRQWHEHQKSVLNALEKEDYAPDHDLVENGDGTVLPLPLPEKGDTDLQTGIQEDGHGRGSAPSTPETFRQRNGKRGSVKTLLKFAVAAAILVVVVLAVTRYLKKDKNEREIVVNNKKRDTADKAVQPDRPRLERVKETGNPKNDAGQDSGNVFTGSVHGIEAAAERDALFAENFKADFAPVTVDESLKNAIGHYRGKAYEGTIAGLDKVIQNTERGEERTYEEGLTSFYAYYYRAQSYLALGRPAKALPDLRAALKENPGDSLTSGAQWYLALAYLKQGNIKNAQNLLNELGKKGRAGKYKNMAEKLHRRIKLE